MRLLKRIFFVKTGKGRPRIEYIPEILKDMEMKSYQDLNDPSFDLEV